jgi:hypothetical protein
LRSSTPPEIFHRDRFSIHGCGPVGLHDDFFRFPYVYFAIVVAHAGRLGLVNAQGRAVPHRPGDIILLDPRAKHALVPVGFAAEEHPRKCQPARRGAAVLFSISTYAVPACARAQLTEDRMIQYALKVLITARW